MRKKQLIIVLLILSCAFSAFAINWYEGQNITKFELRGLKNVSVMDVDNILYPYRGNQYTDFVLREIETKLYKVSGVNYITTEAKRDAASNELVLSFTFHEFPKIGQVTFEGNEKVKDSALIEALTKVKAGEFADLEKTSVIETAKKEILAVYNQNGIETADVDISYELDSSTNIANVKIAIVEGVQTKVVEIEFSGNNNITASLLRKQLVSKKKSPLEKGFLNKSYLEQDVVKISSFYKNSGYLDVIVGNPKIEDVSTGKHDYQEVKVVYEIIEGSLWHFGGLEFSGNSVYSDEEIKEASGDSLNIGDVLNYKAVENAINGVSNLYFDNGYISTKLPVTEERDDTNMSVLFKMNIVEGTQSIIEQINFSGLEKTKEKVMRRELEFQEGDVFSKKKLTTSAQNLYNTGLLADLDYNLKGGQEEDGVVLDFKLEEGSTMDIQFGATFGGSATGFPISGFLAWSNNNFRGLGQNLSVSTNLSPSTQSIGLSFGDDWFLNHRWSNSFSFSFSHTFNTDEYQLGTGSPYYDGDEDTLAYPKPFQSYEEFQEKTIYEVDDGSLMDYDLFTLGLGYNTGYKWIFDSGRLSVNGGLSFSFNKAKYDDAYVPYRKIIEQYGEDWKMSNKLSMAVQWDGRDYVKNTTKGYVVSLSGTTAGGVLGGLSNYNKLSLSAAGYHKIVDIPQADTSTKPLMLCGSSAVTIMLPQFRVFGDEDKGSWQPAYKGATQDEMLYIDGMTIARGHDVLTYQSMLWDNMLEVSYQLAPGVIQAEAFVSGTYAKQYMDRVVDTDGWYLGAGIGLKLKVSGFPLGFYVVDNAKILNGKDFEFVKQPIQGIGNSNLHFVLAISTSLI